MRKYIPSLVVIGLLVFSTMAMADVITIDVITDSWQNPTGGSNVGISNNPSGTADTASWGAPPSTTYPVDNSSNRSGYQWISTNPTPFNVNTDTVFDLGEFIHDNFQIPSAADAITSIELHLVIGTFESPTDFTQDILFTHEETPNFASPCAEGGSQPCPDLVSLSNYAFNQPFMDNTGNHYFFSLLGFSTDGGAHIDLTYLTQEGASNSAHLYAIITENPIPEPSSLILLGIGISAIGLATLRKRK